MTRKKTNFSRTGMRMPDLDDNRKFGRHELQKNTLTVLIFCDITPIRYMRDCALSPQSFHSLTELLSQTA